MNLRHATFITAFMLPIAAGPASAQFQPPPQQPQGQAQQPPPCLQEFIKLRDDAQKRAAAIQAASQRKATPKETCALFNAFSASEVKLIKYANDNSTWCGIPPEVAENLKKGHARTAEMRSKICQAAAAGPARPAAPSLSDALNAPIADSSNIKTGRGTFDTLTGTPLGAK
ncbi:MAG: hypothetical protein EXR03_04085 [Pseudolabrys sp.]|nr:hypothetical protein [Pseudolabrys sp.]